MVNVAPNSSAVTAMASSPPAPAPAPPSPGAPPNGEQPFASVLANSEAYKPEVGPKRNSQAAGESGESGDLTGSGAPPTQTSSPKRGGKSSETISPLDSLGIPAAVSAPWLMDSVATGQIAKPTATDSTEAGADRAADVAANLAAGVPSGIDGSLYGADGDDLGTAAAGANAAQNATAKTTDAKNAASADGSPADEASDFNAILTSVPDATKTDSAEKAPAAHDNAKTTAAGAPSDTTSCPSFDASSGALFGATSSASSAATTTGTATASTSGPAAAVQGCGADGVLSASGAVAQQATDIASLPTSGAAQAQLLEALQRLGGTAGAHSLPPDLPTGLKGVTPGGALSSAAKESVAKPANNAISQAAQNPAKPGSDSGTGSAASNSDNSSNSGGNAQKDSNSDSAAEVKAAGLASVTGDQSPHAPADAPAQSAGAAAGISAAANQANGTNNSSANANASNSATLAARPDPTAMPTPQSLNDVVKASDLYQRVGGAEMHISMNTDLLGSIDVRAVMHQSTLTATIGVERADVQTLLANELPALQHSLSEQSLHIHEISVMNGSIGAKTDLSGNAQQQAHTATPYRTAPLANTGAESAGGFEPAEIPAEAVLWGADAGRISIHV